MTRRRMARRRKDGAWPLLVALVATACAGPVATPAGGTAAPTIAPGSTGSTPGATTGAQASGLEANVEVGPGSFYLSDPQVGLAQLASYTETLTVSFAGTADGQSQTWSRSYRLQHTAQPSASLVTVEVTGDTSPPDPRFVAEAAGTAYQGDVDGTCSGRSVDPADSIVARYAPAGLLPGLMGAEEAGAELANGVTANHYTFDERAMLDTGADSTGEIWVAIDGGYVVRFLLKTTADAAYFGGGLAGTITWDYQLIDVNAVSAVALPEGCQLDVPIMADASNALVLARYVGFDTASSVTDAVAFYKQQLPSRGWQLKSEPFKGADRAVVEFAKGSQVLNLLVTTTESGTRVDLTLSVSG